MQGGLPDAVRRRLDPDARYGLRLTLVGLAIALVAVPFSSLLLEVVAGGPLTRMDGDVADAMNRWVSPHPLVVDLLQGISWFGRAPVVTVVVAAAVAYVLRRGQRRLAVFLAVTPLGGAALNSVVKIAVDRPRPVVDHPVASAFGKSFPSGHAMSSTVAYGALLLVFLPLVPPGARRPVAVAGLAVPVVIGLSRLFLGVHFVTDVVGGWLLGAAWLVGAVAVFQTWRVDLGRRRAAPLEEGIEPESAGELR